MRTSIEELSGSLELYPLSVSNPVVILLGKEWAFPEHVVLSDRQMNQVQDVHATYSHDIPKSKAPNQTAMYRLSIFVRLGSEWLT